MNIPSLAQMRIALAKQSNPDQLMDVGINEIPDVYPKIYVQPDKGVVDNFPPPGGVRNRSPDMPIGGIDTDPKTPGQQLMPQSLMQPQQQPEQQGQPQQPTEGAPQAPQAQQSNILSLTPQGQALSALKPVPQGMADGGQISDDDRQNRVRYIEENYRLPNLHKVVPKEYLRPEHKLKTVQIFRGIPKHINEKIIRPGDWVALDKKYASEHGGVGSNVVSMKVPADHVAWAGTDMNEYFYVPRKQQKAKGGKVNPDTMRLALVMKKKAK